MTTQPAQHGADRRRPTPSHNGLERHVQTVLTMGVAALMAWQLTTIEQMRVELAILSGRVDALAARVDEASSERYRSTDAHRDFALRDQAIKALEARVEQVEGICGSQ
uniref:Uncharacterized protein n=1 Tax=Magnetococcus massalia (strain MO-1) TaxID=451514 RepID=A0A1S7LGT4_MAGMO|nr:conserved protein of unknown function [Candidatus Magnetococcus massalia]